MSWFERLTGIEEQSHEQVQAQLSIAGEWLVCPNRRRYRMGRLEMPTLGELRQRVAALPVERGTLALREVVADVKTLHAESANAGALFQVASQFNLLEMVGPSVTPERGVGIYGQDPTQGPACAIAAGAGTIYRNYFVPLGDQRGQRADRQIDCLADLGEALGNADERLWRMQNGYACPSEAGLRQIDGQLRAASRLVLTVVVADRHDPLVIQRSLIDVRQQVHENSMAVPRTCTFDPRLAQRKLAVSIVIVVQCQPKLLQIITALNTPCGSTRPLHRRKQQGHQDPDQGQ